MDFLGTILWPIKWVIELILVGFHTLWTTLGLDPDNGATWVLSIVGLVLVVRAALIPIFVRQIKNQRRMMEVAPQLKKIQDKYKGKRDQFSREAMSRETMALYKDTGTNPLSTCLPLLLQMQIFFSLYSVLHRAAVEELPGIGLLNAQLSRSFGESSFLGAPLQSAISTANGNVTVIVIATTMVILMSASQFITQLQIMAKNMSEETKASPMFKQQRILLYILPLVFAVSGIAFPLGVMFYWWSRTSGRWGSSSSSSATCRPRVARQRVLVRRGSRARASWSPLRRRRSRRPTWSRSASRRSGSSR